MTVNIVEKISDIRNNALAIIGIIYGIGYLSWSIYAYKYSLGVVSAVESQYLVSGLVPFILLSYSYYFFKYKLQYIKSLRKKFPYSKKSNWRFRKNVHIFNSLIYGIFFTFLTYIFFNKSLFGIHFGLGIVYGLLGYYYLVTIFLLYMPESLLIELKKEKDVVGDNQATEAFYKPVSTSQVLMSLSTRILLLLLMDFWSFYSYLVSVVILLPGYFYFLFPHIPQELGGVKPKLCVFEAKKEDFLFPRKDKLISTITSRDSSIILSDTVLVYYYNDDKLVIKTRKDDGKVYELSRETVKTITWLD